jgi:hypothetical protein
MEADLAYWRDNGYSAIVERVKPPSLAPGVEAPPLYRWFDPRADVERVRVARFGCARCSESAAVAVIEIVRDTQGSAEPVTVVTYQQRRRRGADREVRVRRATLHMPSRGTKCMHGPLLAHMDDESVTTFCHGCGELPIPWALVVDTIRNAGGWRTCASKLKPKRVVWLR